MSIQLPDGHYTVVAPRFQCGMTVVDGRVDLSLTSPTLRRLAGMQADAFACYARAKGWRIVETHLAEAPARK